jgi:hypothetical protein
MKTRLPLILSAAALLVSLLGATPLGEAARSTIAQVVPRAKTADFAKNAGKLNGHKSSTNPRVGQIPVVGADGKLSASIGAAGPQGAPGAPGVSGYQQIEKQITIAGDEFRALNVDCPGGKVALGAGHYFKEGDADELSLVESRPISNTTWRFKVHNLTGGGKGNQSLYIICANVTP